MAAVRSITGYLVAVVVTAVLGSLIQTQFNLAAITSLGTPVPAGERFATTWHDLAHFAPLYAILIAFALGLALPIAALLVRLFRKRRIELHMLSAAAGVTTVLILMNQLTPITPIAATRDSIGLLSLSLPATLGGAVYALIYRPPSC